MLLQEHQGYLHIFPAIPDKWKEGSVSFKNLRSYGGVLVSAKWKKEGPIKVCLQVPRKTTIRLKNIFSCRQVCVEQGKTSFLVEEKDGFFHFECLRGIVKIHPKQGM